MFSLSYVVNVIQSASDRASGNTRNCLCCPSLNDIFCVPVGSVVIVCSSVPFTYIFKFVPSLRSKNLKSTVGSAVLT